jgi:hypothetical protein
MIDALCVTRNCAMFRPLENARLASAQRSARLEVDRGYNCGKTRPITFFAEGTPMVKVDFPFPLDEHGDLIVALAPLFKVLQDHAQRGDCTFPV